MPKDELKAWRCKELTVIPLSILSVAVCYTDDRGNADET